MTVTSQAVTPLTPCVSLALMVALTCIRLEVLSSASPALDPLTLTDAEWFTLILNLPDPTCTVLYVGAFFEACVLFALTRTSRTIAPWQFFTAGTGQRSL